MPVDSETRQRLWELLYDLLTEEEAAKLRARIESDPETAQAYAEVHEQAKLIAEAARLELPPLDLHRPSDLSPRSTLAEDRSLRAMPSPVRAGPSAAGGVSGWLVTLAAALLLAVSLGGYFYHRQQLSEIAADHLRLRMTGPARLQAGAVNEFSIATTTVTGEPVSEAVEFALRSADEMRRLLANREHTNQAGLLNVSIPPDMDLPSRVLLEVTALRNGKRQTVTAPLAVDPVRFVSHLSLDRPLYRPGDTIRYRSLSLSRFGLAADRPLAVQFEIHDPSGAVVPGSESQGITDRGVGSGEFVLPESVAGGQYTLVARSLEDAFPEERHTFFIRSYRLPRLKKELEFTRDSYTAGDRVAADLSAQRAEGGAAAGAALRITATVDGRQVHEETATTSASGSYRIEFALPEQIERGDGQLAVVIDDGGTQETVAETIPINLGSIDVRFYPEGGQLVPGLENRVYFTARNPLGKPVELGGTLVDSEGFEAARVEAQHDGMGAFSFVPRGDLSYRLKVEKPSGVSGKIDLPFAAPRRPVVLTTGRGIFEPGRPLEFNIRSAEPGLPLVTAAWCRGVLVGHQPLVTSTGANEVSVPLDPEANGVIRLTVYDYDVSPPEPIAERLVWRRPARRLDVRVGPPGKPFKPGDEVQLELHVTDESGKPAAAILGVSVVDDALVSLADGDTASMATHFRLTSEVEKPDDLEKADFYLSDDPKAGVALDLLLGTQGWRRFAEKTLDEMRREGRQDEQLIRLAALGGETAPPAMFDNLGELQERYRQSLAAYRTGRTRGLNVLTTLSLFGGMALLLLVALLSVLKIASGVRLWIPAISASAACAVIGVVLMAPEPRSPASAAGAVAFAPFHRPLPVDQVAAEDNLSIDEALDEYEFARDGAARYLYFDDRAKQRQLERWGDADRDDFVVAGRPLDLEAVQELGLEAELGREGRARRVDKLERAFGQRPAAARARKMGEPSGGEERGEEALLSQESLRFIVREYAHQYTPGEPGVRSDFTETLYWHPMLVTDAGGRAVVRFDLSDAVTTFRVSADAHGDGGRIGSGQGEIVSRIPFNLEPKLPLEVTAGDRIELPVAVANDSSESLPIELSLETGPLVRLEGEPRHRLELAAGKRGRKHFTLDVVGERGDGELTVRGLGGRLSDAVRRSLSVVPPGFPASHSYSGTLEGKQELVVNLPDDWVPGSMEVSLNVFPSSLADLQKGLEGMLREPTGCFEQASTANYPNVLSLDFLETNGIAQPEITRRSRELLAQGYARLTGYESPTKGYEWFGGDPGHEALTAYGLMQFRDMARVYEVDQAMIERTAEWLLARRDGRGGYQRNAKALDSFGSAPQDITDAYITWALSESGQEGIEAEIKHAVAQAAKSDDPYLIALAAASALNGKQEAEGRKLLDKLKQLQAEDGRLEGKNGSITRSGGLSLAIETTALAAIGWMKAPEYAGEVRRAIQWIIDHREGSGSFGSTQATILALKAIIEDARSSRRPVSEGELIVRREETVVRKQQIIAGQVETISIDGLEGKLEPGENRLAIELTGENRMPYVLDVAYRSQQPASDDGCPVRLSTKLAQSRVVAGQTVALTADVENITDEGQPMTVAILGLPAGLEVRPDQLEDLKKARTIDYYETRAREVICYWRSLAPKQKVAVKLDLVAAVPGRYTGPASRAYLYYTDEQKQWSRPLEVEITRE